MKSILIMFFLWVSCSKISEKSDNVNNYKELSTSENVQIKDVGKIKEKTIFTKGQKNKKTKNKLFEENTKGLFANLEDLKKIKERLILDNLKKKESYVLDVAVSKNYPNNRSIKKSDKEMQESVFDLAGTLLSNDEIEIDNKKEIYSISTIENNLNGSERELIYGDEKNNSLKANNFEKLKIINVKDEIFLKEPTEKEEVLFSLATDKVEDLMVARIYEIKEANSEHNKTPSFLLKPGENLNLRESIKKESIGQKTIVSKTTTDDLKRAKPKLLIVKNVSVEKNISIGDVNKTQTPDELMKNLDYIKTKNIPLKNELDDHQKRAFELAGKFLDEADDLEPDYILANRSISGIGYDIDTSERARLYTDTSIQMASFSASDEIKSINIYAEVQIKSPDEKQEPTFEIAAKEEDNFILSRADEISEKTSVELKEAEGLRLQHHGELNLSIRESIEAETTGAQNLITENKKSETTNAVVSSIIKEGVHKDDLLRSYPEVAVSLGVDFKNIHNAKTKNEGAMIASMGGGASLSAPSQSEKGIAGPESSLRQGDSSASPSNFVTVSGRVNFPRKFSEYSRGYVEIFLYEALGDDGYPGEYPPTYRTPLTLNGDSLLFKIENVLKDEEYFVVAEFFPSDDMSKYNFEDNKKYFAFFKEEPIKTYKDINDVEISFESFLNTDENYAYGYVEIHDDLLEKKQDQETNNVQENSLSEEIKNIEIGFIGTPLRAYTDKNGEFKIPKIKKSSAYNFEIYGNGIYPSQHMSCESNNNFKIFSDLTVESYIQEVSKEKVSLETDRGIIIGKLVSGNLPENIIVDLSTMDADGPYYFNKEGKIDLNLKASSENGRFIYFNVPPGLNILGPHLKNEDLPGVVVDVSPQTISYVEIEVDSRLSFSGVVINGFADKETSYVSGAEVNIIGAPNEDRVFTDEKGFFEFKNIRAAINHLHTIEVTHKDFPTTRLTRCVGESHLEIYIFPMEGKLTEDKKNTIIGLEKILEENNLKFDPSKGIVMGSIMNGGKLQLDVVDAQGAKVVYFDAEGNVDLNQKRTSPIDGNFLIINVPVGHNTIVAIDEKREYKNYFTIRTSESIINTVVSR